ncbi:MAG: MJ0042-type zinc finger domain-containing protein [Sphingomonadales bacterium]|jgi:predicted Zn finger-like uncharacterized protein
MKIECPSCLTRFNVTEQTLLPAGRIVKCSICQNRWHATVPKAVNKPGYLTPGQKLTFGDNDFKNEEGFKDNTLEKGKNKDIEDDDNFNEEKGNISFSSPKFVGWVVLVLFLLVLGVFFGFFKTSITEVWPPANKLYSLVGIDEHDKDITFQDKTAKPEVNPKNYIQIKQRADDPIMGADGSVIFIIKGTVTNSADIELALPRLRGVLRNENKVDIHEWVYDFHQKTIPGKTSLSFETRVLDFPTTTREYELIPIW